VAPLTIIIRRRRHETDPITDRNAFRLCIDASDRDRLLDESKWSKHIVISDWYHLNPTASRQQVALQVEKVEQLMEQLVHHVTILIKALQWSTSVLRLMILLYCIIVMIMS